MTALRIETFMIGGSERAISELKILDKISAKNTEDCGAEDSRANSSVNNCREIEQRIKNSNITTCR